jgi:hypothetical protein
LAFFRLAVFLVRAGLFFGIHKLYHVCGRRTRCRMRERLIGVRLSVDTRRLK